MNAAPEVCRYPAYTQLINGEQTWGPLFSEGDGEPIAYTDNNAHAYMKRSLDVLGISPEELAMMKVLNIGSGREAIVFQQMGAGQVTLFDISKENIDNVKRYVQKTGTKKLLTIHGDIQQAELAEVRYDLIFLVGVFQYIQVPPECLMRLSHGLKTGGRIY